ncbi:MAG: hypothetical protein IPK69_04010 [Phycisphaerales bacterium]|nr:MAG: hypothetical protein IPK69_04010 [Phycisphaerales bacterium]
MFIEQLSDGMLLAGLLGLGGAGVGFGILGARVLRLERLMSFRTTLMGSIATLLGSAACLLVLMGWLEITSMLNPGYAISAYCGLLLSFLAVSVWTSPGLNRHARSASAIAQDQSRKAA